MYKLPDVSLNGAAINNYFLAWKNYDTTLLGEIFDSNANYIIRNKGVVLRGYDEIREYWLINEKRQRNLKLSWKVLSLKAKTAKVYFHASFFGVWEDAFVHVQGEIIFYFNQENKITKLTECYRKKSIPSHLALKA